ncbi:MAG: hypothetical protein WBN88_05245, partial [Anderseniella sp.]
PCIMPMARQLDAWVPEAAGWGFIDTVSGKPVDPAVLVSDELIEMTDWELQDFAVQVVRDGLVNDGRKLMSAQGNPSVDPSIWFVGDDGPEWVVVRAGRYPKVKSRYANQLGCDRSLMLWIRYKRTLCIGGRRQC